MFRCTACLRKYPPHDLGPSTPLNASDTCRLIEWFLLVVTVSVLSFIMTKDVDVFFFFEVLLHLVMDKITTITNSNLLN